MNNLTSTASYAASGSTIYLGLTVETWGFVAILIGIFFTIATFAVHWWYREQLLKIAKKK